MKYVSRALLALCCIANPLQAMEVIGGVSGRYERSDNINQVEQGEQDEDMLAGRVDLTMVEESGRVRGSTVLYAERLDYRKNLVDDETRYNLATLWAADLIENRLVWHLDDVAGRRRLDARDTDIGANRIDQNVLSTGPDVIFSTGPSDQWLLSARYGNAWYGEDVGIDNERYTGGLSWRHDLSPITSATLSYSRTRTHFLESNILDFDREESSLTLVRNLTRSRLSLEGGYNRVLTEDDEQYDGMLGEAAWRYQWQHAVYTRVYVSTDITDTAQEVIENAANGGLDLDLTVATDVYRRDVGGLTAGWNRATWRGDLGARYEEREYREQPLDQKLVAADVGLARSLTERSEVVLLGTYSDREYFQTDRIDRDLEASARYNHTFSERLFGAIGTRFARRHSTEPLGDFDEHVVFVEFGMRQSLLARERGRELRNQGLATY